MFPLEMVAFPGETIKLHIFEPRYRQLIGECLDHGTRFGIPPFIERGLAEYGTEMAVADLLQRYDDGRMDVACEGTRVFRIARFHKDVPGKLYSGAEVEPVADNPEWRVDVRNELQALYDDFHKLLKTGHHRTDWDGRNLSFRIGQEVGLSLEQKAALLALPSEGERQAMLVEHLRGVLPVLRSAEETKKRIRANGSVRRLESPEF
jgi:hypothetical protein